MTSINTGSSMNDTSSLRSRTVNKTENGTTIVSGNDNSDKDLFLKLLVAQMKNQDPFNSQDPTQYITQLAQFNMLEQSMALNENIEYLIGMTNGILANSAVGSATNLIGKEVEVLVEEEIERNGEIFWTGHTKEYIKIALQSRENLRNCIVKVQIEDALQIIH